MTAEYAHVVEDTSVVTLGAQVMDFLRPLNPRQTKDPGVFVYEDPSRGSGWLRLEEFRRIDAERVQELVRMAEIESAVGREPLKNADYSIGNALVVRSSNPWTIFVFASVLAVFSIIMISRAIAGAPEAVYPVMGAMLGLVAVALFIFGGIRVRWWHRARAYSREHGGDIPSDLKGL